MIYPDRKSVAPLRLDDLDLALSPADIRIASKSRRLTSLITAFVRAAPAILFSRG